MTSQRLVFHDTDLSALLGEARECVLRTGTAQTSSRGQTFSLKGVQLVWERPRDTEDTYPGWEKASDDYYQSIFVEKSGKNAPEQLLAAGEIAFPYTYAARSRYWDNGWGYVLAVISATRALGVTASRALESFDAFNAYLEEAGEFIHLQPLLAVWDWLGKKHVDRLLAMPESLQGFVDRSRIDQLERIIQEIEREVGSRRAITASFVYPEIDHRLDQILSVPPYQSFQILPAMTKSEPLHSLHLHRSLDASEGVQLDFHHDLRWLQYASSCLGRSIGTISIVAGDFHVYLDLSGESHRSATLEEWLLHVTDGYRTNQGKAKLMLKEGSVYRRNAQRIYQQLGE